MSPAKALFTLVTLISVPLLGYYLFEAWWGALIGLLIWLFLTGHAAQKKHSATTQGGSREKGS